MLHCWKTLQQRGYRSWNAHIRSGKAPAAPQQHFSNARKAVLLQRTRCPRWVSGAQLSPTFLKCWPASPVSCGGVVVDVAGAEVFLLNAPRILCISKLSERNGVPQEMCAVPERIWPCFNGRQRCLNSGGWYPAVKNIFECSSNASATFLWCDLAFTSDSTDLT